MPAVLEVDDLSVRFATPEGEVAAVSEVSFAVAEGESVGVVGESGSGKTQAFLSIMGLLAANGRCTGGARFRGRELLGLPRRELDRIRGVRLAMIFQDPMTSLNPVPAHLASDDRGADRAPGHGRGGGARREPAAARSGRHPGRAPPVRSLPARVLGRHAPAGDDRDRALVPAGPADRRRADHRARRHGAGADPGAAAGAAARARHGDRADHPRPRRRRGLMRARARDVCRPDRRAGADRADLRRPAPSLHARAAALDAAPGRAEDRRADRDPRAAAEPPGTAGRMRIPRPLPVRLRALPRAARAARVRIRAGPRPATWSSWRERGPARGRGPRGPLCRSRSAACCGADTCR